MDSRSKILEGSDAAAAADRARRGGKAVILVLGAFDPLLAGHARNLGRLAREGAVLFVAITDPPRPLLPASARAELVASLGVVDYVMLGNVPLAADEVHHDPAADAHVTEELVQHVQAQQRQALR